MISEYFINWSLKLPNIGPSSKANQISLENLQIKRLTNDSYFMDRMMVMNAIQLMIEAEKQTTSIHQTTGLTGSSLLTVFLKLYGMF